LGLFFQTDSTGETTELLFSIIYYLAENVSIFHTLSDFCILFITDLYETIH